MAVVDPDEIERLQLANSKQLDVIFTDALARIRRGEGLSHKDVWEQIESLPNVRASKVAKRGSRDLKPKKTVKIT